jgi:hypothetical protein
VQQQIQEGKFRQRTIRGALYCILDIPKPTVPACEGYLNGYFWDCVLGGCFPIDFGVLKQTVAKRQFKLSPIRPVS